MALNLKIKENKMVSIKQYSQTWKPKLDYFCVSEVADILTEALPGDQFVSIDGKKTYFDIGPSNAPGGKIVKKKLKTVFLLLR